jgi:hypothetical protein
MSEQHDDYRQLRHNIMGYIVSQAIAAVTHADVVELLAGGPLPVGELATRARVDEDALRRFLRVLVAEGLFTEVARGTFALTGMGRLLLRDQPGSLRHLVDLMAGEAYEAWARAGHSLRTGKASFDVALGQPMFPWLSAHPDRSAVFDRAQAGLVTMRMQPIVDQDWSGVKTVVDVGGGSGALLTSLLTRHQHLHGVLFDQPHVVEAAEVPDRCRRVGGDFFGEVPGGGDIYVLAQILHDWDDADAARILGRIASVIPAHGRLYILEQVVADDDLRQPEKLLDLHMLVLVGGRERSEDDWRDLLAAGGFTLLEVQRATRSSLLMAAPANHVRSGR